MNSNRQGAMQQTLRVQQTGYGGQAQPGRGVPGRIQNGKAGPSQGWNLAGLNMANMGLPSQSRQQLGGTTFAQSVSGSQQNDLANSDFSGPNSAQSQNSASMWGPSNARVGLASGLLSRNAGSPHQQSQPQSQPSLQHQQPEDMYQGPSRLLNPTQAPFRPSGFSIPQTQNTEEFPPLGRNVNGDIGQERSSGFVSGGPPMATFGNGHLNGQSLSIPTGNGVLHAAANHQQSVADVRSGSASVPPGSQQTQHISKPGLDEDVRQKPIGIMRDEMRGSMSSSAQPPSGSLAAESRHPLGAIGRGIPNVKGKEQETLASDSHDIYQGMSMTDRYSFKGLRHVMSNYPQYQRYMIGIDPASLGVDFTNPQKISRQVYSLLDSVPPRPPVPDIKLPQCYTVANVQPIENKISSFNTEILMWIFYSSPGDVKQLLAARELYTRNWRWHKKEQIWLTKDETVVPQAQPLSNSHERGFYVVWDTALWRKDRREMTLYYADLEANAPVI